MAKIVYIEDYLAPKYEDFDWITPCIELTDEGRLRDLLIDAFTCDTSAFRELRLTGFTQQKVYEWVQSMKETLLTVQQKSPVSGNVICSPSDFD